MSIQKVNVSKSVKFSTRTGYSLFAQIKPRYTAVYTQLHPLLYLRVVYQWKLYKSMSHVAWTSHAIFYDKELTLSQ